MTQAAQNPLTLIKGVVSARHKQEIELSGYSEALSVLERHFSVYEQRLRVLAAPACFPDGEVLLDAANQGLEQLRGAVDGLKGLDPAQSPDRAKPLIQAAEEGFGLLVQLKEVTDEKRQEFQEAYDNYEEPEEE